MSLKDYLHVQITELQIPPQFNTYLLISKHVTTLIL